ncbi:ORFL179W, partial [Human betaherpesvirus 5]
TYNLVFQRGTLKNMGLNVVKLPQPCSPVSLRLETFSISERQVMEGTVPQEEETPHRPSALWFGLPACTHC